MNRKRISEEQLENEWETESDKIELIKNSGETWSDLSTKDKLDEIEWMKDYIGIDEDIVNNKSCIRRASTKSFGRSG